MNLKNKFKKWWNSERVNRAEKGTSQDMCITNGDAVLAFLFFLLVWLPIPIYLLCGGKIFK